MDAKDLRALIEDVPDDWTVVVEQPEGDRYHTDGIHKDNEKGEFVIKL